MKPVFAEGFEPVYNENSRVLVLGSFPSVKSRQIGFYYGNPQNRFWKTACGYFGEEVPPTVREKRDFLLRRGIALWDVILSCEVEGSADASIRGEVVADVSALVENSGIRAILCNGAKSYSLRAERFPALVPITKKMPSTSPANPRFSAEAWRAAFDEVFL